MGSLAFFFFFICAWAGQGEKKNQRTSGRCQAELTEIVESGSHFSFFFRVLVDSIFPFFRLWTSFSILFTLFTSFSIFLNLFPSFYLFYYLFTSFSSFSSFSLFFTLFHSFSLFFLFFLFSLFLFLSFFTSFSHYFTSFPFFLLFPLFSFFSLFCHFSHLFHLFHIVSLVFFNFFFFFFAFFFAFSLTWPRRSLAALPCLPLPYLTLPLLSSPSLTFFFQKKKKHRDFQQISVLRRSSCPPKRLIISRSIHMSSCRRWIQIVIPNASCLWDVCVVKARS